jgi:AcrR family transcriptional regulator
MPAAVSLPSLAVPETAPLRGRILRQARADFFAHGYSRFTMDGLAEELGMSKKTLYVHFAGKDEIIGAVIDDLAAEIRADADTLLRNRELNLAEKLRGFVEGMLERMAALHPRTVRDLQRFAPKLYAKVEEVRGVTLPYVFGRFVEEGQMGGLIRTNLPPGFAIEFFLHAMQGMMHPTTLERLRLAPRDVIANGIDLFFGGLLTHAGRKQYEKLFPR